MGYVQDPSTGIVYDEDTGQTVDMSLYTSGGATGVVATGRRKRSPRIVITERTLKGIAAIMRLSRSGHAGNPFRKHRRKSW